MTLERQPGKHLGIRISGSCPEPGIFIVEILEDSITALDGRIKVTLDIANVIVFAIVVVVNKKIFFRLMTDSSLSTAPM